MTKEQKLKMYEMRLDGYTLQEIADEFGVSRQYVDQVIPSNGRSRNMKKLLWRTKVETL